jgi:ribosomal protein S18 acetylase RimI-like enzyme
MQERYSFNLKKSVLYTSLFLLLVLSSIFFYNRYYINYLNYQDPNIYVYNELRDRDFILNMFKTDWYWLVAENVVDFSPEYMLDNMASSNNPSSKGDLNIYLFLLDEKPVGFITYFVHKRYNYKEGNIQVLAIDKNYRNKGIGKRLVKYAINDLRHRLLCDYIVISTRNINHAAIKCYTSLGFKPNIVDDGFVYFKYSF